MPKRLRTYPLSMLSYDDFQYAVENTNVIVPPQGRLETFGSTLVHYHLVTEDMDHINLSYVREGSIEASKPQIITPAHFSKLLVDGFGEQAAQFASFINQHAHHFAILRYGFQMRKAEIQTYPVHEPAEDVLDRVRRQVEDKNDPLSAVIQGVDEGWEVCLLKFMFDLVNASGEANLDELRRRGLI